MNRHTMIPKIDEDKAFWPLVLLLVAMGSVYGILYPAHQSILDYGRVFAGITPMVPGSPWTLQQSQLWSLLNQGAGLLLKLGYTDTSLDICVTGVQAALAFTSTGLLAYAMGRNIWLAIVAPLAVFELALKGLGPCYPIDIITGSSHGAFGLSSLALTLGLMGSGKTRSGLFVLGVLPAVHLPWGGFAWLVMGASAAFEPRKLLRAMRMGAGWLLAGVAVSVASFLVQRLVIRSAPIPVDTHFLAAFAERYYKVIWDHRTTLHWSLEDALRVAATVAISLGALSASGRAASPHRAFMCRALALSALLAGLLLFLSNVCGEKSPFFQIMPGKFFNLAIFPSAPLFIGSLRDRRGRWFMTLALSFIVVLAIVRFWHVDPSLVGGFMVCAAFSRLAAGGLGQFSPVGLARPWLVSLAAASMAVVFWITAYPVADAHLHTWANDGFQALVNNQSGGLLLAGNLPEGVVTRRPLAFNWALDYFPYLPETAKAIYERTRDLYGVDIMTLPDPKSRLTPAELWASAAKRWKSLTREEWVALGRRYGFTGIVVSQGMRLNLPLAAQTCDMQLYAVEP